MHKNVRFAMVRYILKPILRAVTIPNCLQTDSNVLFVIGSERSILQNMSHFIESCKTCKCVIGQYRCSDNNIKKKELWCTCDKCKKNKEVSNNANETSKENIHENISQETRSKEKPQNEER